MSTREKEDDKTAEDRLKAEVSQLLGRHGWDGLPWPGAAIAAKTYETAVGERGALVYFSCTDGAEGRYVLTATYHSEGRNALSTIWEAIGKDDAGEKTKGTVARFTAQIEEAVSQTYAVRLRALGVGARFAASDKPEDSAAIIPDPVF